MGNGQRFFHLSHLQWHFCDEKCLVLARTQLFHQLLLPKCSCIHGVNIRRESSGTVWLLWPFYTCEIFASKIYVGFKVFVGTTIYKNWISWKFNPRNIYSTKISASTVCTDCLHNYHQYITFDTQDQYTLWQTLCNTVYWHRSCAVHVARPHPLLTLLELTTLTSNTTPNEVKESYSNLVNALYRIAVLCRQRCVTKLHSASMYVICNLYQVMFCSKGFAINTKPEFHRTHTCTLCVLSTAVLCRDQCHCTAVNGFNYIYALVGGAPEAYGSRHVCVCLCVPSRVTLFRRFLDER